MSPKYRTGQQIHPGDIVKIGAWDGIVESIITAESSEYFEDIGEGIMLIGAAFGRLHTHFDDEDLVLIRRGDNGGASA